MTRTLKVMLYSHDSWGLGHLRRNLAIANALSNHFPNISVLLVSGSPCATQFSLANGVDVLKLPSVTKIDGQYAPRQLGGDLTALLDIRQSVLTASFEAFSPHLLIVDHQVTGLSDELLPVLEKAVKSGVTCVFGMRDVLDASHVAEAAWNSASNQWAFAEAYQQIFIYGDQRRFDTVSEYPTLQRNRDKCFYTGLVVNEFALTAPVKQSEPRVLVMTGGGEDGGELLHTYVSGLANEPQRWQSIIVTGPLLAEDEYAALERTMGTRTDIDLMKFHPAIPSLLASADLVVSMAGYNSCAEISQAQCPAVLVPRTHPRQEQKIRADYLQQCEAATSLIQPSAEQLIAAVGGRLKNLHRLQPRYPATNGLANIVRRVAEITGQTTAKAKHTTAAAGAV